MEQAAELSFRRLFAVPAEAEPVLDRMVGEAERSLCLALGSGVFTAEEVGRAARGGPLAGEDAQELTRSLYRRGLFDLSPSRPEAYRMAGFYGFLDVFAVSSPAWNAFDAAQKRSLADWCFNVYFTRLQAASSDLPPTADRVVTLEEAFSLLENDPRQLFLAPCDCRSLAGGRTSRCGKPVDTCLSWRRGPNTYADRGIARPISVEEGKKVLREADGAGLMHTANANGLCNCCADCCFLSRARERRDAMRGEAAARRARWPASARVVSFDAPLCARCGACLWRCPFGIPRERDGKIALVGKERCAGCGLCVNTCPTGALRLAVCKEERSERPGL